MPESSAERLVMYLVGKNIMAMNCEYFHIDRFLLQYIMDHIKQDIEQMPELQEHLAKVLTYDGEEVC